MDFPDPTYGFLYINNVYIQNPTGLLEILKGLLESPEQAPATVPELLEAAATTFRERNEKYKDNKDNVGAVMVGMFPDGVVLKTKDDFVRWHLFELMVVKMTRFANSGLQHKDSIHDLGIYAFMVEKETK
jgi:hypothetical protein